MPKLAAAVLTITCISLAGCSNTVGTFIDAMKVALNPGEGVTLTNEQLARRTKDALYVTVGDLPRAQLALDKTEHGQDKWRSADKAFLVMEQGRIVKTAGFSNDLLFVTNTAKDPLKQPMSKIQQGQQWQSYTDWLQKQETGYKVTYEIVETSTEKIQLLEQQFDTKKVTEHVSFASGETATNLFWFDLTSGVLLKSRQQISPFWPEVELVHISNAARLAGIAKAGVSQ
ncbi:YjbF family lipoprotein [Rheinheimera mesophila]|uniref:YjbF family lipoprotein n=1 Tax=Rheinheimera mesophila TaxID=1547515 RepID=A0A3P3QPE8_9GAMM|nr:YjbF family lipoprotein [Rheinheimera mesophila]RRJ23126.1 YjbF family lipoprotein [Rheinheimera mesophila]